jgi:hypothetical protein
VTTTVSWGPVAAQIRTETPKFRRKRPELPRNAVPIIGIDPGQMTGWSLLVLRKNIGDRDVFSWNLDAILRNRLHWQHGEINTLGNEDEAVYNLYRLVDEWPHAAVVVEDFILRAERKEKSRELLSPVRITAKLETYLWRNGRRMFLQQPSQAKTTCTDERLGLWGCKVDDGMPDHARDADRHAVLFARRCLGPQGVGIKRNAWQHLYGE